MRGWLYDSGLFPEEKFSVAVVSVGNLSVGGTGKTPVAAWIAQTLAQRGIRPGIVLRGYGGDETLVHQRLNANIPVIVAPNRPAGIREAIARGAKVVILDDAFQHRRAARDADVLLVDADSWSGAPRLLPAGPWREPLRSARRASLIIITRKTADKETLDSARRAVAAAAPNVPIALVHLLPGELRSTSTGQTLPLHALRGADLTAIAAIARPESFFRQLTELGAVVRPHSFADHHAFTSSEAKDLAAQATSSDFVVCTLKDAVKLESIWPAEAGSLWYVSQRLRVEDGQHQIDRMLDNLLSSAHPN
jgi:tetraacyldisaccharide 4'-kinase